ncbi:L-asparaginase, type I [Selenomonas sp. oral taxon 892 str. F0426]|uniref:asparaginase n=1 Tax=Selenomonas sp. oral taxon 892 TaxID=1321785 RepID=UPI0003AD12CE|nr:asparaginase [Selenomonas sp. oral taxon 892]ERJ90455.1 L-asparaginase, type I [Selenomonas sp. oral taxon 892 str. F0426]
MKNILLIATGGTIASRKTAHGLRPALSGEDVRAAIGAVDAAIEVIDLLSLDSTNIAPSHWQTMARKIAEVRTAYDGFIVTHGTDTMAYTSAALYYMLEHIDRPVVITGAQRPLGTEDSDAQANLRLAYEAACSGFAGVCLAFGGRLIHGNAAKKMYSLADDAFRSIGRAEIDLTAPSTPSAPFRLHDALDERVAVIRLYPGMKPITIDAHIASGYRGIILEGYGCGSVPGDDAQESFLPSLDRAKTRACTVVLTTQCIYDGADLSHYEVGVRAAELGVLSGGTLPIEALYVRLMQLLANIPEGETLKSLT